MKNTLVISMVLAGMLFVVAPVIGLNDVQAKSCMAHPITSAQARAASIKTAKRRARQKWRHKVGQVYGNAYNNWQCAKRRDYIRGSKRYGRWRVHAKAIPCTCN